MRVRVQGRAPLTAVWLLIWLLAGPLATPSSRASAAATSGRDARAASTPFVTLAGGARSAATQPPAISPTQANRLGVSRPLTTKIRTISHANLATTTFDGAATVTMPHHSLVSSRCASKQHGCTVLSSQRRPPPRTTPPAYASTDMSIDDSVQGRGNDSFHYVGRWNHCKPCRDGAAIGMYNRSSSSSRTAGNYYTVAFRGTGIALYSVHGPTQGIEDITLDGRGHVRIDLYSTRRTGDVLDQHDAHLATAIHILTVRVTGRKNRASRDVYVVPDRVIITVARTTEPPATRVPATSVPTRTAAHTPTSTPTSKPSVLVTPTTTAAQATSFVPTQAAASTSVPQLMPTLVTAHATATPQGTNTTPASSAVATNTPSTTHGSTAIPTSSPMETPTATSTPTNAPTETPTLAATPTSSPTDTPTATATSTATSTSVPTTTFTVLTTSTPLPTLTATLTGTSSPATPDNSTATPTQQPALPPLSSTTTAIPPTATDTSTTTRAPSASPTPSGSAATSSPTPTLTDETSCPSPWTCEDIGHPQLTGTQSLNNGVWSVTGSGGVFQFLPNGTTLGTSDQFRYVWQPLAGDGSISAHVATLPNIGECGVEGIMLRQSADPSSPYYAAYFTPCGGGGPSYIVQSRAGQGEQGTVQGSITGGGATPQYLAIGRVDNTFTAYLSYDNGTTWVPIAGSRATVNMGTAALAGMVVTSNNAHVLNSPTFDSVEVTTTPLVLRPDACPTGWNCADIGAGVSGFVLPGTEAYDADSKTWSVTGSGGVFQFLPNGTTLGTSDQFRYVWQPLTGDGNISAHVATLPDIGECGVEGIMLRQSADPSAPYYAAYFTPCGGPSYIVQSRAGQGEQAALVQLSANDVAHGPRYLRIGRAGDVFTAYVSADNGTSWVPVDGSSVTIHMSTTLLAGMIVTSNRADTLNAPSFDDVSIVRQQVSGSIPWHSHHMVRMGEGLSASVDLVDGHIDVTAADMHIPGRGPDLTVRHTWDSALAASGATTPAGQGWVSSLTPSMGGTLTGVVIYTDTTTGATWPFTYTGSVADTGPYTTYRTPPGLPWQLTTSTGGYTLTNVLTSEQMTFDGQGRLQADRDSYGNSNTLSYGADGVTRETNSGGRALAFSYANGLLTDAQSPLWQSSGGSQGQHVAYGYTGNQLTSLTWGVGTTDAVTATFGYSGTELTSVTTPYTQATHMWTINYDGAGRVTSIVSPPADTAGPGGTPTDATVLFYDATGAQVVDGANTTSPLTTTYTFDGQGEPITVTDGLDHNTFYTYDADHDVLTTTDANNHTTTNDYAYVGPNGNIGLITQTVQPMIQPDSPIAAPEAPTTQYYYDPTTHDRTETLLPNGGMTLYRYDAHHGVIATMQAVDNPNGDITLTSWRGVITQYDQYGERVSTTDGRGVVVSPNPTEINHLPTGVQLESNAASYTHSYSYTPQGDLSQERTPPIVTTRGTTTSTASVTTSSAFDGDGNQIGATSANGNTTTTEYDHLGQAVRTTLPVVTLWDGTAVAPSSTTGYDGEGNVVRQVDANGAATLTGYDPLGREIRTTNPVSGTTVITYNATEKVAQQDPQGNVTRYAYDGAGRLRQEVDPTGSVTQDKYDPVGNTTAITTGDRNTVIQVDTRQYDALNRIMTDTVSGPTTPARETLTWYDLDGNRAMVQNPNGDSTVYNYDLADQLIDVNIRDVAASTATNDQKYEEYSYDAAGSQVQSLDGDGRATTTTLDGDNRVIQTVDMTGTTTITTTQQYDPDGNAVQTTRLTQDGSGPTQQQIEAMTVNAADWTTTSTDGGLTTAYGYDAAGQERSRTILNGAAPITTTLDAEGRATAISEALNSKTPYMSLYGYNPNDLPITATLPNGTGTSWTYDGDSRVTGLVLSGPSAVTAPLSTTYSYGYDAAGQTTAISSTVNGITIAQTLVHNAQGYLTGVSGVGATQSLEYDGNGNISTSSVAGQVTTYHYDAQQPNQLNTVTSSSGTTGYRYDKNGDTAGITSTAGVSTGVSYDAQARLATVTLADETTVSVRYNAAGQRAEYAVSKSDIRSLDERYNYRGSELGQVVTVSGTTIVTDTYIYDPSGSPLELIRQQNGGTSRYWYHTDRLGSVVALTNSSGNVVDRYSYDIWGMPVSTSESVPQRLRYAGYWWDSELNWYWVSVRSYDPGLKRWLQPDPSQQDGVRTFAYVSNDPVDATDPSGLCPQCAAATGLCAVTVEVPFLDIATCAAAAVVDVGTVAVGVYFVTHHPTARAMPRSTARAMPRSTARAVPRNRDRQQPDYIVRCGESKPQDLIRGYRQHKLVPNLAGFSVQYAPGEHLSVDELATLGACPNPKVSYTTSNEIAVALAPTGYVATLTKSPGIGSHYTLSVVRIPAAMPEQELPLTAAEALSAFFHRKANPLRG